MSMRPPRALLLVMVLLALPVALAVAEAAAFRSANRVTSSIVSSGEVREYLLHVPARYDPARPSPLVISMHAAGLWPAAQMRTSRWNELANEDGFIVVYPASSRRGVNVWNVNPGDDRRRDVRFIAELIDTIAASWAIDPARIYADGLSNGGGMAFVLSCTMSERIAAVGLVASAQTLPWSWCTDERPVPMMAFHGTADAAAPYAGGFSRMVLHRFPPIDTWVASWARRNRCAPEPFDSVVTSDVTRRSYPGCAENADVVLYTIHGGGHSWPGGESLGGEWTMGPTNRSVDATRVLWDFYRSKPRVHRDEGRFGERGSGLR